MIAAPGIGEIEEAADLLAGVTHRTPLLTSSALSRRVGGELVLKAEHLQRTGSFKIRGAYVHIARLPPEGRTNGVVAASAGNHAQGVAFAASAIGVGSTVVMPVFASLAKAEATRGYGATVELHGETFEESLDHARRIAEEREAAFVHAFDDPWVIAGQGTVGLEIADDAPDVDRVIVPVGGGGLAAGVAVALRARRPDVPVIGVHPAASPVTIADGAAVAERGRHTAPLLSELLTDVVEVGEEPISEAILLLLERTKQVIEGAGALPLAALLAGAVPATGRSLLVTSGGNIDPGLLMRVMRHGLGEAGRYLFVRVLLEDRPGQLQRIVSLLADMLVNILSVVHHRAGALPVGAVEVELTLETRDREHAEEIVRALREAGYTVGT